MGRGRERDRHTERKMDITEAERRAPPHPPFLLDMSLSLPSCVPVHFNLISPGQIGFVGAACPPPSMSQGQPSPHQNTAHVLLLVTCRAKLSPTPAQLQAKGRG